MQSTRVAIDSSKGHWKGGSMGQGMGKGVPRNHGKATSKGQAGGKKGKGGGKLHSNGRVKGLGKNTMLAFKGKGEAEGKSNCKPSLNSEIIVSKCRTKNSIPLAKGKGKDTTKGSQGCCTVKGKGSIIPCRSARRSCFQHSAAGNRMGRNGPRTNTCSVGWKSADKDKNNQGRKSPRSKPQDSSSMVCAICQSVIEGNYDHLDCMHAFHTSCASLCVAHVRRAGCPICRAPAPVWLNRVSADDSIDAVNSSAEFEEDEAPVMFWPSLSDDGEEINTYMEALRPQDTRNVNARFAEGGRSPSSDFDDYFDDYGYDCEMDQLRDEFPDLDSDALENLRDERLQDFDECGSYYSHGS